MTNQNIKNKQPSLRRRGATEAISNMQPILSPVPPHQSRVSANQSRVPPHQSRVPPHQPLVPPHQSSVTSNQSRVTSNQPRVTSNRALKMANNTFIPRDNILRGKLYHAVPGTRDEVKNSKTLITASFLSLIIYN